MRLFRTVRRLRVPRLTVLRTVQAGAAAVLAVGAGGFALTSGAGALGQTSTTSTTTTSSSTTTSTTAPPGSSSPSSGTPDAAATNPNTYNLSAQANALDAVFTIPNLPLGLVVEAGPYGASASVNSLGQSLADAGAPYSPTISSLPGAANGLGSGVIPPLPPLPGYVSANYPGSPNVSQSQGGYQLAATSSPTDAKGTVNLGVQPAGSSNSTMFASAETTANNDGSVSVKAAAGLDALTFGQLFDIANVSSSLSMTQQANGQPTVMSKTSLGTITLLGQTSGLLANSVGVLGIDTPISLSTEVIGTLNSLLSKAGVQVAYLPETFMYTDGTSSTGSSPDTSKTLQAVDSGALKVTVLQNLPSQGPTGVAFTLGRVYLSTTDTPGFTVPTSGDLGDSGTTDTSTGLGSGSTFPSLPTTLGSTGTGTLPALSGGAGTTATTPTTSPSRILAAQPTYSIEKGPSAESLYLVLILVALAVLFGSQAVRFFAVRLALTGRRSP